MARPAAAARRGALLHAVDDVTFSIGKGESVGLVGESGCGKSTLVRLITRMLDPTAGDIVFDGRNIGYIPARLFPHSPFRPKIQMVFQDPTDSLNPRHTAFDTIAEPLQRLARVTDRDELARRVMDAADKVGLPQELLPRYPHQLSGGQKARVGIARAVAMSPALLVLDEPTAALDVSVQATILKLLADLKRQLGMSYLFVSHDLNVVRMLCDRVIVMYLGRIVEQGPTESLFRTPAHPYTAGAGEVDTGDLRPPRRARGAGGRAAEPDRPRSQGVPLLRALPAPARALPHGGAAAARDRGGPPGGVPLRMTLPYSLDLASLARDYASGALTPAQVVSDIYAAIASAGALPVWIHLAGRDEALAAAAEVEKARAAGAALPLYGIPFAVKDNIDVAGHSHHCRVSRVRARFPAPPLNACAACRTPARS